MIDPQTYVFVILAVVLSGVAVFALWTLAKYLRTKVGAEDYAIMMKEIRTYVEAAEQKCKSGELAKDARYQYVTSLITQNFPQLTKEQIDAYVEGAVHVLNLGASLMGSVSFGDDADDETVAA